ncbi:MAG TPA: DUF1203 domain-containing protein [Candidatus Eremiobacteraceae bacterium]|nr:DUF1203 domain-containing protein [Candidatus Eremiobacteraceae bacterium]
MSYRIVGLAPEPFLDLFQMSDDELAARHIIRTSAAEKPGYPCRITLDDAEPGESVLLLNYEHQTASTPYRSSHAIYVRENARRRFDAVEQIPPALRTRTLSVRAFDADGMMVDADIVEGEALESLIARFFAATNTAYLHVHNAKRGCFAARVERA